MRRRIGWMLGVVGASLGTLWLAGCIRLPDAPEPLDVADGLQAEYVSADAAQPAALAFLPDGRVLYGERETGLIRIIVDGKLKTAPFAEVPVNSAGGRGLLGLAVHPDFNTNHRVYVFYTRSDTGASTDDPQAVVDNRVVYFEARDERNVAAGGEVFIASFPAGDTTRRVGGRIAFDADNHLFVALGDGGTPDAAQNAAQLAGKILRYDDLGGIPADNPTVDSAVYALGLRDPRGLALDPQSGSAFVLDRNEDGDHEICRVSAGANFGWPTVVGMATTDTETEFAETHTSYVDPLYVFAAAAGEPAGAAFNPSTKYGPGGRLALFVGTADFGRVYRLTLIADRTRISDNTLFASGLPTPLTDVGFTPAGTLYVATEDAVLRVVPAE